MLPISLPRCYPAPLSAVLSALHQDPKSKFLLQIPTRMWGWWERPLAGWGLCVWGSHGVFLTIYFFPVLFHKAENYIRTCLLG